ncbi:MAG: hypothetical protein OSA48_09275 [Akkermansiaceae bacterium]|nr:hypothetical protein [Akkermansiaceae bacterium]
MLRKLAGSSFAAALIALMVMKHVVLGFCLCQSAFVANPATCCNEHSLEQSCACCATPETPAEEPCKDCVIDLHLDVEDFVWNADEFTPADQLVALLPAPSIPLSFATASSISTITKPVRGPPPGRVPIYLRQSVLRL